MAAILFFPNVLYILGGSRGQKRLYLGNLTYDSAGFLHILKGLLFPGEPMREYSAVVYQNWSSTSAYLPLFGISLVLAYLKAGKKTWLSNLLWILGIIVLFPLSESLFLLFREQNQRWWYMLVLMMTLASAKVLDNAKEYPTIRSSAAYCGILTVFYLAVRFVKWSASVDSLVFDLQRFTLYYLIALIGPLAYILLKKLNRSSYRVIVTLTLCGCVVTTALTLHYYRCARGSLEDYRELYEAGSELKTLNEQYRYNSADNVLMLTGGASGIGAFCTTVENSSREFDELFGHYSTCTTQNKYDVPGCRNFWAESTKLPKIRKERKLFLPLPDVMQHIIS